MNDRMAAAKSRLSELAAKFLDRTDGDVVSMRAGLERVVGGDAGPTSEIRHLAHRMVGTGATLGFESLSECARRIEVLTEACPPGHMPDEQLRAQLAAALDALAGELQRLRS